MPFDAFISYSHKDQLIADSACAIVEGTGVRCWIAPRNLRPGVEWAEGIAEGIDQCRVLVLIFSSNSNESRQVRREVGRAFNNGLTIVPVRIEAAEPNRALAFNIEGFHWLDALTEPRERYLRELAQHIKAILETQPEGVRERQEQKKDQPPSADEIRKLKKPPSEEDEITWQRQEELRREQEQRRPIASPIPRPAIRPTEPFIDRFRYWCAVFGLVLVIGVTLLVAFAFFFRR